MIKLEAGKPLFNGCNQSYHSGKTCYVSGALEGETVLCTVTLEKKNYRLCRTEKVLHPSVYRISPGCSVYGKCGGCQLLHVDYPHQLRIKQQIAEEILHPFHLSPILPDPAPFRYRNKALIPHHGKRIGFYREKSNKIIEFSDCLLHETKVNELVDILRKSFAGDQNIQGFIIRTIRNGSLLLCLIVSNPDPAYQKTLKKLVSRHPALVTNAWISVSENQGNFMLDGENFPVCSADPASPYLIETVGSSRFHIGPTNFFQVNTRMLEMLYEDIRNEVAQCPGGLVDAYCGSGTIGIYVKEGTEEPVTFIENFPASLELLKKNLEISGFNNYSIIGRNFEQVQWEHLEKDHSVLVVDPPRCGIHPKAVEEMNARKFSRMIYVSCNPLTLKRDLTLLQRSYRVKRIRLYDMFPHTYHFESMAVLEPGP